MTSASLFLCHRVPFPPNKGDKIRSHALLGHLAKRGPVHVGCFVDEQEDQQYLDDVRSLAGGECKFIPLGAIAKWGRAARALASGQSITTSYFESRQLAQWVSDTIARHPIENYVVFGSAMARYLLGQQIDERRVLFDMVDVDSDKWRQYATASWGLSKWIYAREARSLESLEREAARRFGTTLLVSPFETETFRSIAAESAAKIKTLSNGVDLEAFSPGEFSNPFKIGEMPIVMTGRMDYRPNYAGAIWFSKRVAPLIFERLPTAHLCFVGSGPPAALRRLVGPKISVTGRVDDVRPYLQYAAAIIAPVQLARGLQNKVLEAMAMEKPVVATHEATRALDAQDRQHLWIENDPERFAEAVVEAIQGSQRTRVARNARSFVEEQHNWKAVLSTFDCYLEQLRSSRVPPSEIDAHSPSADERTSDRELREAGA